MIKKILFLFAICITGIAAKAQTPYYVTHTSGTIPVGPLNVTVSPVGTPSVYGLWCNVSTPYWIGQALVTGGNGYMYSFSAPVRGVRLNMGATNVTEEISFFLNGIHYNMNNASLSAFPGNCTGYNMLSVNLAGNITVATGVGESAIEIISTTPFDSIRVQHNGLAGSGTVYDFAFFEPDTVAIITRPFADTLLCAGDTLHIPYKVSYKFRSNNVFTAQLSDANGSFATPTTIGTLNTDTAGIFRWQIPTTLPQGLNYRVRIVSTSPVRTSADNGNSIVIGMSKPANVTKGSNTPVCSGKSLTLNAGSSTPGVSYKWTGPNSYSTNSQNATVTSNAAFSHAGRYYLTVYNYGCSTKDSTDVAVVQSVTSVSAGTDISICDRDTIKLSTTSTPAGATYSWTGPNGFTSNVQNPKIPNATNLNAGNYIVTATLNGCTAQDAVAVTILVPNFSVTATSNSPVCDKGDFFMNASSTATGVSYSWTGPNGFTATGTSASLFNISTVHTGNYIVTATANGCSVKDTAILSVTPLPSKPVIISNNPLCTTDTLRLNATSATMGVSYSWTGPNGFTATTQNAQINNPSTIAAGDYRVSVMLNGCTSRDTEIVTITQSPTVTAGSNSPVCVGGSINLNASSDPGVSYSWSGPNGFVSAIQNPNINTVILPNGGNYIVTASLNGCRGKDTVAVVVNPNPATPVAGSNMPLCTGGTLNLTAGSSPGATYNWTGPNGFASTLQNPSRSNLTTNDAGNYVVTAGLNGCYSTPTTIAIVINAEPFVNIFPSPSDSICVGTPATFTAIVANAGPAVTYKWTKNFGTSILSTTSNYTSSSINDNDIIHCLITDVSKCGSDFKDSSELKMTVLPWLAPSVSIISNPTTPLAPYELVTFTATPVNGGSNPKYQWQRNGNDVIGATSNTWGTQQLSDNDNIRVILTSNYKCPQPAKDTSNTIKVVVLTGINNLKEGNSIQLYPNPNNGSFTIKGNVHTNKAVSIKITNAIGQLVYSNNALPQSQELNQLVNLPELANGTYQLVITIENNKYSYTFKIVR